MRFEDADGGAVGGAATAEDGVAAGGVDGAEDEGRGGGAGGGDGLVGEREVEVLDSWGGKGGVSWGGRWGRGG